MKENEIIEMLENRYIEHQKEFEELVKNKENNPEIGKRVAFSIEADKKAAVLVEIVEILASLKNTGINQQYEELFEKYFKGGK